MLKIILFLLSISCSLVAVAAESNYLTPEGCSIVSQVLESAALVRDSGKPISVLDQEIAAAKDLIPDMRYLISKEVKNVYGVYARLTPAEINRIFFSKCYTVRGSFKELNKDDTKG